MEQNKRTRQLKSLTLSLSSLSGYIVLSFIIGVYLDNKFFNHTGVAIIISVILGIVAAFITLIRVVMLSRADIEKDPKI